MSLDPTDWMAARRLSRLLRRGGDLPGAIDVLDRALRDGPEEPALLFERATARIERGDPGGSEDLDRAIELDPGNAWLLHNRTILGLGRGDLPAALEDAARSARLDPTRPSLHALEGDLLERLGRLDEARAAYVRALEVAPPDWPRREEFVRLLEVLDGR